MFTLTHRMPRKSARKSTPTDRYSVNATVGAASSSSAAAGDRHSDTNTAKKVKLLPNQIIDLVELLITALVIQQRAVIHLVPVIHQDI